MMGHDAEDIDGPDAEQLDAMDSPKYGNLAGPYTEK